MNDLLPFTYDKALIRVIAQGDVLRFIASDVATVLGYRDAGNMVRNLDDDEAGTHIVSTNGGDRNMLTITESGLYNAIFKSRRPEAKAFRRWVTGTVLPAVRRHGRYSITTPEHPETPGDFDSTMLTAGVAVVREARRLFGPQSARVIWMKLGLPAPLANSAAGLGTDPLAADLRAYIGSVHACTIDEAATAVGIVHLDNSTRLRIGALLRLLGWFPRKVRRNGPPVNLFSPAMQEG